MPHLVAHPSRNTGATPMAAATATSPFSAHLFHRDLRLRRYHRFMMRLRGLMSAVGATSHLPDIKPRLEHHFRNLLHILSLLLGFDTQIECFSLYGRSDCVLRFSRHLTIVFEFKVDSSAAKALRQIESRNYMEALYADNTEIVGIGINFSTATNTIDQWLIKTAGTLHLSDNTTPPIAAPKRHAEPKVRNLTGITPRPAKSLNQQKNFTGA